MTGEFIKVKCKCKNEQMIFSKPASVVRCLVCNEILADPTGGRGAIKNAPEKKPAAKPSKEDNDTGKTEKKE